MSCQRTREFEVSCVNRHNGTIGVGPLTDRETRGKSENGALFNSVTLERLRDP
jgi:hypothetical protein